MSNDDELEMDRNDPGSSAPRGQHRIFKPGETFGKYKVVRCISAGLLVNYYHMQHASSLQDVTVGVFHMRTMDDPKFLKRLRALEKTIEGFDREGIPKIRESDEVDGFHCMIMDPVQGKSLNRYFAVNGTPGKAGIGPEDCSQIMARILGLLGYAHAKDIDHRDMDSDLILVDDDGGIEILGLGVKAMMGREVFESIVSASVSPLVSTKTVGRLNSFDMISPEYREGKKESKSVDLFAVGMIGYWLLTARKAVLGEWEPPTVFMEDLPVEWDDFFKQTLQRDPDVRYPSCKIALLGLKKIYQNESEDDVRVGLIQRQIDRIPVPKSIAERGELATRIYRLSLIGLVGVTLTALAALTMVEVFTEPEEYRKKVAMKIEAGDTPDLRVRLNPEVAKVTFEGTDSRFVVTDGLLELKLQPGEYNVVVSAPNHFDRKIPVFIQRGTLQDIKATLRPKWSDLRLTSNPGTTVSAINSGGELRELGVTDSDGHLNLETGVFSGSYTLVFEKKGYATQSLEDQQLSYGKVNEISAMLEALPSSLTILTSPTGARVIFNGNELGTTPLRLENLQMDETYLIAVKLAGYRMREQEMMVSPGENLQLNFGELEPKAGELSFNISMGAGAQGLVESVLSDLVVVLDGEELPYGASELNAVLEGEHTVQLKHPIYQSQKVSFKIEDREALQLEMQLEQLPAVVILTFSKDAGSQVYLNEEPVELVDGQVAVPSDKVAELKVVTPNHFTLKRRFDLKPKEQQEWLVELNPIPGPDFQAAWTLPYVGIEMVWVEAGEYAMGSPMEEHARLPNEGPRTDVRFTKGFWIGAYEITQGQFRAVMRKNPSEFSGAQRPVDSVTWGDAMLFCEYLNRLESAADRLPEGYAYRLPTESEWEYAARAGSTTPFHFGAVADPRNGNFQGVYPRDRTDYLEAQKVYGTVSVGSYPPNDWGLYDVHGNVQEWTLDKYNGRLEGEDLVDPRPRTQGSRIAVRGGSWQDSAVWARTAFRRELRPSVENAGTGFRVVLAPAK